MTHHVFTYGSLMFEDVWTLVVAGRYARRTATLLGHARYRVRDETYPGMVAVAGSKVVGMLYLDVDDADVARLDRFEGGDYERRPITVVDEQGVSLAAETYLYRCADRMLPAPWDPDGFAMQRFIESYCRDRLGPDVGR